MKRLIVLLLMVFTGQVIAQQLPDMGLYKVRITGKDKTITVEIKPAGSAPAIEPNRFYNWYSANQIRQTQGGYSGTLLNGQYSEFYLNKNLKEQGYFDKGLKNGVWKNWTEDGILLQSVTWQDGVKQGVFILYDEKGNIKQKGTYKQDMLNGKQFTYNAKGEVAITVYKDDQIVPKKTPRPFWSRINIFKKKH